MKNKIKKIKWILTLIVVLFHGLLYSQKSDMPDSLFIKYLPGKGAVIEYEVKQGSTIYSISRMFNVEVADIYTYNYGLNKKPLGAGMIILVPVNKESFINSFPKKNSKKPQLFYRVGYKETLFRIARVNLDIEIEDLKKLNRLKNTEIDNGQLLYLGYLDSGENSKNITANILPKTQIKAIDPVRKEKELTISKISSNDDPKKDKNNKFKKKNESKAETKLLSDQKKPDGKIAANKNIVKQISSDQAQISAKKNLKKSDEIEKMKFVGVLSRPVSTIEEEDKEPLHILKYHKDSGVALWNKHSRVKGVYVLSNDAALNSMIEISNPMVQRKIFAKVIGNIPTNTYPDNVKVVLSPEAAMTLGALDSSFFVKLHYLK